MLPLSYVLWPISHLFPFSQRNRTDWIKLIFMRSLGVNSKQKGIFNDFHIFLFHFPFPESQITSRWSKHSFSHLTFCLLKFPLIVCYFQRFRWMGGVAYGLKLQIQNINYERLYEDLIYEDSSKRKFLLSHLVTRD